jgi:RecJ-like exonuclease
MTIIDCPHCQGEGYLLAFGNARFSSQSESYEPDEAFELCTQCNGEGKLEVCALCLEPFQIIQGLEACGCDQIQLPKAA